MTALERAPEDRFQDAHEMALLLERHAFRNDDFDPAQLVTELKQLFPADHAGWKATVGIAQAVEETSGQRKITAAFPLLSGAGNRTGGPTLALHKPRSEATTRAELERTFPSETAPDQEFDEGPPLPRLTGWGDAQPDPGSEAGEPASVPGDDAAAYAALRRWAARRTRLRGRAWLLLAGAIAAVGVFAGLRWRAGGPVTPPAIVDVRDEAATAEAPPVVEPLRSVAEPPRPAVAPASTPGEPVSAPPEPAALAPIGQPAPTATPTPMSPPAPPAAAPPVLRRSPPVPVRVVKKPVHKPAIAHRAPGAAKPAPAPARQPTGQAKAKAKAPATPEPRPLVRPGWRDPFD
jgi:hypothetical protein